MFFNIKTPYNGRIYDSKLEAKYAEKLDQDVRDGILLQVEPQAKFLLFVNGQKDCVHFADFLVTYPNGKKEVREVKGKEEDKWLRKLSLFVENYPHIPYITVKDKNGRFVYYTAAEILDRAGIKPIKSVIPHQKQYSRFDYLFSAAIHHFFSLFFK